MARKMKDSGIEWIGEIPEGWEIAKAKYFIDISHGSDPKTQGFIPVYGSGSESFKTCGEYKEGPAVLIGRKGATLHIPHYIEGKYWNVDTAFDVKSKSHCILKFYYYLAACFDYKYYISQTTLPGMTQSNYYNMFLPVPSLSKQFQIATYLDAHGAAFDFLISKVRSSIEEYKKLKQAVITQAVTKGVRGEREMKDSGVEWIGRIPSEWYVAPFTKCLESTIDYRGKTPEKVSDGTFLVTAKNIKDGKLNYSASKEYVRTEQYEDIMHRGKPEIGDVLFTTEAPLGEVCNVDRTDFALAQRIIKFRGIVGLVNNYYMKYWIMSSFFQNNLRTFATGSTAQGIKASKLGQLKLILPTLEEQQEIADYLDAKCAEIDRLIAKKEQLVKELESYKKSLIYEVVTGKREV